MPQIVWSTDAEGRVEFFNRQWFAMSARHTPRRLRMIEEGLAPDLLVTDHRMPGMTGVDLARNLRSHRPDLAVLIVMRKGMASRPICRS